MKILIVFLRLCFLFCFFASTDAVSDELPHDVYIWQRLWTPALRDSIESSKGLIDNWRVLAAQTDASGHLKNIAADRVLLTNTKRPVVLVFRIETGLGRFQSDVLVKEILSTLGDWQGSGTPILGVEIDHDCATNKLDTYTQFLILLRIGLHTASSEHLRLSATALPAWLNSPSALQQLLEAVDEAVLQVHAVQIPTQGLFNQAKAKRWIEDFNELTEKPFRVALPTYGYRLNKDEKGKLQFVEGEMPAAGQSTSQQELTVWPLALAALLNDLNQIRPEHLQGIVWFRLPTASDRRALQLTTWHALLKRQPLQAQLQLNVVPSIKNSALYDLVLINDGLLDAPLPTALILEKESCTEVEALNGYRLTSAAETFNNAAVWRLEKTFAGTLRARHQRVVGWMRCSSPEIKRYVLQ